MGLINNKEKQAAGGNWGHPRKWTKRHTKLDDPLIPERPRKRQRKNKKRKKLFTWCKDLCPFCGIELPIDKTKKEPMNKLLFWRQPRVEVCPNCHARHVDKSCPCYNGDTWIKEGIYKHNDPWNCGFTGKKIFRKGL